MITIGVDAHKRLHVALALDEAGREIGQWQGKNSAAGWRDLAQWAGGIGRTDSGVSKAHGDTEEDLPSTSPELSGREVHVHTEMMQRLGDAKGRDMLRAHERTTRDVLKAGNW